MESAGQLTDREVETAKARYPYKLTNKLRIGAANMREQTALFKLARKSAEVACLKEDLVDNNLHNASSKTFRRTFSQLFKTADKSLPTKTLAVKRMIQKQVWQSITDKDGAVQTVWKHGPTARLTVLPHGSRKRKTIVHQIESSKPASLGP